MPRPLRYDVAGAYYHLMARGNNREPVFRSEKDFRVYRRLLGPLARSHGFELYAYCLMTNHVHLLVRSGRPLLSRFMMRLQGLYARYFNREHGRKGHAFEGRFVSRIILNASYMHEVGRYIHMNPVAAGMTQRPEDYAWSSMGAYLRKERDRWLDTRELASPWQGARGLEEFYAFTVARQRVDLDQRGWPKMDWYADSNEPPPLQEPPAPSAKVEVLLGRVAAAFGCSTPLMLQAHRHPRLGMARAAGMWYLRQETSMTLNEVADLFGMSSGVAVATTIYKLQRRAADDAVLRVRLSALK